MMMIRKIRSLIDLKTTGVLNLASHFLPQLRADRISFSRSDVNLALLNLRPQEILLSSAYIEYLELINFGMSLMNIKNEIGP